MVYIPPILPWARARQKAAQQLFDHCMGMARHASFYQDGQVPDTFDGRFEMVVAFVGLCVARLQAEGRLGQKMAQSLFDVTFLNLELACRESGIGDLSIPRHMKRMMAGFNGRLQAYQADDLTQAVRHNIYGTLESIDGDIIKNMADYFNQTRDMLKNTHYNDIINARFEWINFKQGNKNEDRQTATS